MAVRNELASERRELRNKEIQENKEAMETRLGAKERRAAAEEKKAEIMKTNVENDELVKRLESEQKIIFMYQIGLDEKGRPYLELLRDQILISRGYGGDNGGGGFNEEGGAISRCCLMHI
jgi:hypothetical protein